MLSVMSTSADPVPSSTTDVVVKLSTGYKFVEGPVWIPADVAKAGGATTSGGYLLFSDIPGNTIHKWDPATKSASPWRTPSDNSNGMTLDGAGRLLACHHGTRVVTAGSPVEGAAERTIIAGEFNGGKFNSPNDIVVAKDGAVWFTDPTYGMGKRPAEQPVRAVYRLEPRTGAITLMASDFDQPNGLCFSPDETWLYVGDSGKPAHIRRFKVNADKTLSDGALFYKVKEGVPDGFKCDKAGTLYITVGNGIAVVGADGTEDRIILVPESPANCNFGGDDGKTLFITARNSLYSVHLPALP